MNSLINKIKPLQLRYCVLQKYLESKDKYTPEQNQNILKLIESYSHEDLILAQEILSC